uniref:Coatomer subunit zeta n=1 Tax=Gongylonema pulchrum TaxID=637853 RepID=A0A183ETT8_9BILA
LVDNMDIAMLIIDEICDNGVLMETEPQAVVNRCALRPDELTFGDQSISQVGIVLMETEPQAVVNRCALRPDELTFGDQSISQVGMSVRFT